MARFRLIPKAEKFFEDFVAHADVLRGGAKLLEEMLAPNPPVWNKADRIKDAEHRCDQLTHDVLSRLNRTFVTPLDREDIFAMARGLDDVMDAIDAAAGFVSCAREPWEGPLDHAARFAAARPGAADEIVRFGNLAARARYGRAPADATLLSQLDALLARIAAACG